MFLYLINQTFIKTICNMVKITVFVFRLVGDWHPIEVQNLYGEESTALAIYIEKGAM